MNELTPTERRALRARAHSLHPVVSISQKGLSDSVLAEIERGLKAHELIKVRVYGIERDARETVHAEICSRLDAAAIQHIGNVLVVYRANPEAPAAPVKPAKKPVSRSRKKTPVPPATSRQRLRK
jgi:putative YhbY family RNA-binding protein